MTPSRKEKSMAEHDEEFLRLANAAKSRIKQISPHTATAKVAAGALLLDVREKKEFEQGHLPKATNLSREVLETNIQQIAPDKSTPIICYCGGGNRAALAADTLQQLGYTEVFSIKGGFRACTGQTDD
jgi:phage shock protein E